MNDPPVPSYTHEHGSLAVDVNRLDQTLRPCNQGIVIDWLFYNRNLS